MGFGIRGTLGYRFGDSAVEATGFDIFEHSTSVLYSSSVISPLPTIVGTFVPNPGILPPGSTVTSSVPQNIPTTGANSNVLSLPFFNEPAGFQGMWLQAQSFRTSMQTGMGSFELNYRYGGALPGTQLDLLAGLRYLDLTEAFSIYTEDVINPSPSQVVTYQVNTHNHILAPQLGFELRQCLVPWMSLSLSAKGAWGLNMLDSSVFVERGDGLIGFATRRTNEGFAQVYELEAMLDFHIGERLQVRAGYTALWALGVAAAFDQVDFDLSQTYGTQRNNSNIFFHGPMAELMFVF
jgi:hypothetical protein